MKTLIFSILTSTLFFAACNNSTTDNQNKEAANTVEQGKDEINNTGNSSLNHILSSYLQLKNALVSDNDQEAAAAGNELLKAFNAFDSNALTSEQAKIYHDIADDAKEHAEHIGANTGNIKHQREHFETLSQEVYELVKAFGSDQKLYVDHCPMYNNKGADWLSESKDIQNPYFGQEMSTCGTIKEELN
jgi:hypothetical protein